MTSLFWDLNRRDRENLTRPKTFQNFLDVPCSLFHSKSVSKCVETRSKSESSITNEDIDEIVGYTQLFYMKRPAEAQEPRTDHSTEQLLLDRFLLPVETTLQVYVAEQRQEQSIVPTSCASARDLMVKCMTGMEMVKIFLERCERSSSGCSNKCTGVSSGNFVRSCVHKCYGFPSVTTTEPTDIVMNETDSGHKLLIVIHGEDDKEGEIQIVMEKCEDCNHEQQKVRPLPPVAGKRSQTPPREEERHHEPSHHKMEESESKSRKESRYPETTSSSRGIGSKATTLRINETLNLDLHTDEGEDYVISMKVTPKRLFNAETVFGTHGGEQQVSTLLTLPRKRVCPSLNCDVDMDSTLRRGGVDHPNPEIATKLTDMGVDNLLRACRPAKCSRRTVLNEIADEDAPYAASLKSLPLEEADLAIIEQSLKLSLENDQGKSHGKHTPSKHPLKSSLKRKPGRNPACRCTQLEILD